MKKVKYILSLMVILVFTGCNDWFEVSPDTQVSSDDLYASGDGFRMQVNGLYKNLSKSTLYAQELTWGFVDVLGQYYVRENLSDNYKEVNDRRYGANAVKGIIDNIWSGMYKVIADCNSIMEHASKASDDIFEYGAAEKAKVYGEALAVRAFVHFDLLRLFAPAPAVNNTANWIPYVTSSESTINMPLSVNKVLENIENDLKLAHTYMVQWDSVMVYSDSFDQDVPWMWTVCGQYWTGLPNDPEYPRFFGYQRYRMNMASVNALLARVYSYMGEKEKAYKTVESVLEMGGMWEEWDFGWADWLEPGTCKLLDDVIFGLYNVNNGDYYAPYMSSFEPLYIRNVTSIFPPRNQVDARFEKLLTRVNTNYLSIKNRKGNSDIAGIPVIRKSELYYIKGEYLASVGRVDEAVELIRTIRERRSDISLNDLDGVVDYETYMNAMLTDARKEFLGEGQSFYLYKRLNLPVYDGNQNVDFRNQYMLPVPDSEEVVF